MVIGAPPGSGFVISDNPIVVYSQQPQAICGPGYLTPDVEVTMALSRKRLVLASHVDWFQGRCSVRASRRPLQQPHLSVGTRITFSPARRMSSRGSRRPWRQTPRRSLGAGIEITGG